MDNGRAHKIGEKKDTLILFEERARYFGFLFGLNNWKIDIHFINESKGHNATTIADPRYYRATIELNKNITNQPEEWDVIIIHEMIHIVMSLYDFYTDNMGVEGSKELFYIARENSVSQLAHIIDRILKNK